MPETTMRTITVKAVVKVPSVPNFLRIDGGSESDAIDVADVTDDELRAIGRLWIDELLANAAKRRLRGGTTEHG